MAKNYEQLQQQQTFDELMRFLDSQFKSFPDHRAGNAVRYELADVVKSAFAMFSLKSPITMQDWPPSSPTRSIRKFSHWTLNRFSTRTAHRRMTVNATPPNGSARLSTNVTPT